MNSQAQAKITQAYGLLLQADALLHDAARSEPDVGYRADIVDAAVDVSNAAASVKILLPHPPSSSDGFVRHGPVP